MLPVLLQASRSFEHTHHRGPCSFDLLSARLNSEILSSITAISTSTVSSFSLSMLTYCSSVRFCIGDHRAFAIRFMRDGLSATSSADLSLRDASTTFKAVCPPSPRSENITIPGMIFRRPPRITLESACMGVSLSLT